MSCDKTLQTSLFDQGFLLSEEKLNAGGKKAEEITLTSIIGRICVRRGGGVAAVTNMK